MWEVVLFSPFPKRHILDSSKRKGFADDNVEFDENGRKISRREENTGKKKLLVMSNFSFSHRVFYNFGELSAIFTMFKIVGCKLFQFGKV